jgi:hypothetical protein
MLRPLLAIAVATLLVSACSGAGTSAVNLTDDSGTGTGSKDDADSTKDATKPTGDDAGHDAHVTPGADAGSDSGTGPRVYVRINAVQTPTGSPSASQETPTDQRVGILGITLEKSASDPSPLVVVHRATPIDTPYNAGSSTLIGSVAASDLVAGTYAVVRVPVAYVHFTVGATAHYDGLTLAGDLTDVISLTAGTTIAGAVRDRGWYSSTFAGGGKTYPTTTGEDSAFAQPGVHSGIGLDLGGAVAAYVFPLTLTIPATITEDMEIVFTANTYEDFHWTDQTEPGYVAGVFDVSATSYEPVTQLGANSATVTIAPVTTP